MSAFGREEREDPKGKKKTLTHTTEERRMERNNRARNDTTQDSSIVFEGKVRKKLATHQSGKVSITA